MPFAWRISPQTYAWRIRSADPPDSDVPAFLKHGVADAVAAGYDGVEFGLSTFNRPGRVEAVKQLLSEDALALASVFATVNASMSEAMLDELVRQAEAPLSANCTILNVAIQSQKIWDAESLHASVAVLNRLSEPLRTRAIQLCWHPHKEHFVAGCDGLLRVLEGALDCQVCLDLGWVALAGEDPVAVIGKCGSRIGYLHIRDLKGDSWTQSVGTGVLDVPGICQALERIHYGGWMAVELWFDRSTEVTRPLAENAAASLAVLRSAMNNPPA